MSKLDIRYCPRCDKNFTTNKNYCPRCGTELY